MAVYKINKKDYAYVKKELDKSVKKCKECGVPYTVNMAVDQNTDNMIVTVTGSAVKGKWEFLAGVISTNKGDIIKPFNDVVLPKNFVYTHKPCECCKTNRHRKEMYILMNRHTGEIKQIGGSCLDKFLITGSLQYATQQLKVLDTLITTSKSDSLLQSKHETNSDVGGMYKTYDVLLAILKYISTDMYSTKENYMFRTELEEIYKLQYALGDQLSKEKHAYNNRENYVIEYEKESGQKTRSWCSELEHRDDLPDIDWLDLKGYTRSSNILCEIDKRNRATGCTIIPKKLIFASDSYSIRKLFNKCFGRYIDAELLKYTDADRMYINDLLNFINDMPQSTNEYVSTIKTLCSRECVEKKDIAKLVTVFPFYFYMRHKKELEINKIEYAREIEKSKKSLELWYKKLEQHKLETIHKKLEFEKKESAKRERSKNMPRTINPKLAAAKQKEYCERKHIPEYAPDQFCWCGRNIYEDYGTWHGYSVEVAATTHITGCPFCHRSYCD